METHNQHWKPSHPVYSPVTPPTTIMDIDMESKSSITRNNMAASWAVEVPAQSAQPSQIAKMRGSALLSPPVSPMSNVRRDAQEVDRRDQGQHATDPQLFPSTEIDSSPVQIPLFSQNLRDGAKPAEQDHTGRWLVPTPTPEPQSKTKPTADEYELIAAVWKEMSRPMVSNVFRMYQQDPAGHLEKELSYMLLCNGRSKTAIRKHPQQKQPLRPLAPASAKVKKVRQASTTTPRKPVQSVKRQPLRKLSAANPAVNTAGGAADIGVPAKVTSETQVKPKDVQWWAVEDLTPPISTLSQPPYNDNPRCMEVKWTQGPLDLSGDLDKHLLHPAEFHVAQILRLSCAAFMTCKRRLCVEKLRRLRLGIAFTKTHAQGVCRIDVNKTSKIWEAMDQVGWWDIKYYKQWL